VGGCLRQRRPVFVLSGLRAGVPVRLEAELGSWIAVIAFLFSTTAAGMYWWRVDLAIGRYLESFQHLLGRRSPTSEKSSWPLVLSKARLPRET